VDPIGSLYSTPLGLGIGWRRVPRVARFALTLGFVMKPRWGLLMLLPRRGGLFWSALAPGISLHVDYFTKLWHGEWFYSVAVKHSMAIGAY